MAIIKCKNCGGNVSDKAKACPHCGNPVNIMQPGNQPAPTNPYVEGNIQYRGAQTDKSGKKSNSVIIAVCAAGIVILAAAAGFLWKQGNRDSLLSNKNDVYLAGYSVKLVKMAARGDAAAQLSLAFCYESGYGVQEDDAMVQKWLAKAIANGDERAKLILRDHDQSDLSKIRQYAQDGDAIMQFFLGIILWDSYGEEVEAMDWFRKSAEQGWAPAQAALGKGYMQGSGVPQDDDEARRWLIMSAENGCQRAYSLLQRMADDEAPVAPAEEAAPFVN